MNYQEFTKQAGAWGDFTGWLNNKKDFLNRNGMPTNPFNLVESVQIPYKTFKNWFLNDPGTPKYSPNMDPVSKINTFMGDIKNQAYGNIGPWEGYKAVRDDLQRYGINIDFMNPYQGAKTLYRTAKTIFGHKDPSKLDALKNRAVRSDAVKDAADRFISNANIADIETLQQNYDAIVSQMGGADTPAGRQLASYMQKGLQKRVWQQVMQNPMANLPRAAGIFIRQYGSPGVADFLSNPIAFYGMLAGALTLPSLMSSKGR